MKSRFASKYGSANRSGRGGRNNVLPVTQNLQLWLDAADTSPTNIVNSGGSVNTWADKSGNGNDVTQGTGSAQPTTGASTQNGKNVLDFDTGDELTNTTASALFSAANGDNTVFVVSRRNAETGFFAESYSFSEGTGSGVNARNYVVYRSTAGQVSFNNNSAVSSGEATVTGLTNTNFNIFTCTHTGTTNSISANAGTAATDNAGGDTNTADRIAVGSAAGANYLVGEVGELIIYGRLLSSAEIAAVESYLSAKWGIAI